MPMLLEMGLGPTRAYFWSAVNKRPTSLWPGYFLTQHKEIFFDSNGKKLKNLKFLGENFRTQTQSIDGWPNPTWVKNFWPGPIAYILTIDYPKLELFEMVLLLFELKLLKLAKTFERFYLEFILVWIFSHSSNCFWHFLW